MSYGTGGMCPWGNCPVAVILTLSGGFVWLQYSKIGGSTITDYRNLNPYQRKVFTEDTVTYCVLAPLNLFEHLDLADVTHTYSRGLYHTCTQSPFKSVMELEKVVVWTVYTYCTVLC